MQPNPPKVQELKPKPIKLPSISDLEAEKILTEASRLLRGSEALEGINLLRALKENVTSTRLNLLCTLNLGIAYYQVSFLEESYEQFSLAVKILKEVNGKSVSNRSNAKMRFDVHIGKVELQACILFSEMGKHEKALEHAKIACRATYNIVYDLLVTLYSELMKKVINKQLNFKSMEDVQEQYDDLKHLVNNIVVLNHLVNSTKDLAALFVPRQKQISLEESEAHASKYFTLPTKANIDQLYQMETQKCQHLWVYKSKILDQIQLQLLPSNYFTDLQRDVSNNEIIEAITFLAISLYCFSTQTRFNEKKAESNDVLDSEHWLSRSLEIAYMFMPPEAPILNQILTVHDRFHGLDKMTIPQDQEVMGFFKVLKPLSKPHTNYNSKSPIGSPIMIRIQANKVDSDLGRKFKMEQSNGSPTMTLREMTRNNKIRGTANGIISGNKHIQFDQNAIRSKVTYRTTTIEAPFKAKKIHQKQSSRLIHVGGKTALSEDVLHRPHSYDRGFAKMEEQMADKKRQASLTSRTKDTNRKMSGGNVKIDGFELRGKKVEESVEMDFFQKLHSQSKIMETMKVTGNVYINNNINLYISKNAGASPLNQTFVRGQIVKDMSKRTHFANKRRANNFVLSPEDL